MYGHPLGASGNDNAGQEGQVFPQSTSSVRRLYYQTTSLCYQVFVPDDALECPKTPFDLSSHHFYFSLSLCGMVVPLCLSIAGPCTGGQLN
ncbi:hypothetical protein AMTRI_Chr12g266830 [Amborella trichopoda]